MQTQDRLALSASMRTALLVYSGISVKMMVDSDLGADLSTMFMVQYEQGGFAGAHDHPLEETYLILEGEVGGRLRRQRRTASGPATSRGRASAACTRSATSAQGRVRWLETQAPQPPAGTPTASPATGRTSTRRSRASRPEARPPDRGADMDEFPVATSPAPGVMGVDWENRVDFERLRPYRLDRVRKMLEEFDLGAVLLFETSNIRYATATQIGYWAFNKGERWALVTRNGAARRSGTSARRRRRTGSSSRRCTTPRTRSAATPGCRARSAPRPACTTAPCARSRRALEEDGVGGEKLGVDLAETAVFLALQAGGLQRRRRPAGDDARPRDQEPRRDRAAHAGVRDGRRRLPGHLRDARSPASASPTSSASPTRGCSRWARSSSRRSTRSPANAAARIRTSSATG